MTEVHRLTKMTGEEFEAAADSAADPVARDESLRSRLGDTPIEETQASDGC